MSTRVGHLKRHLCMLVGSSLVPSQGGPISVRSCSSSFVRRLLSFLIRPTVGVSACLVAVLVYVLPVIVRAEFLSILVGSSRDLSQGGTISVGVRGSFVCLLLSVVPSQSGVPEETSRVWSMSGCRCRVCLWYVSWGTVRSAQVAS